MYFMTQEEAYKILTTHLKSKNLVNHCLATEACMKAVCQKLHPNSSPEMIEEWGITGLLHDADYETTKDTPQRHALALFDLEESTDFPPNVEYAIKAHNYEYTKIDPTSDRDWALIATDPITGLIVATALITPEKKLSQVNPESVAKKYRQKAFARGVEREKIALCESKLNIPLDEFIEITLKAMQEIASDLGL